ncbi:MAG: hypothetical protein OXU74_06385 [Gemmatimonadota bacterium]|nr:hypothetical protein [Gemmatimonadota bacterium]
MREPPSGWAEHEPAEVWLKARARGGWTMAKVGRYEWRGPCPCCRGEGRLRILRGPDGYLSGSTKTAHTKPLDVRCLDGCDLLETARTLYPFQKRSRVT